MRKVVSHLFMSLDGVVQSPFKWQFDFDDVMATTLTAGEQQQDSVVLGRITYEQWANFWPTADRSIDFTDFINNTQKYVASTTLDKLEWQNSTLLRGDLVEEVTKLKNESGRNIGVHGSPSVVRTLLYADVIDELLILVHPVFAGSGKRLITEGSELKRMELIEATHGSSGTMLLRYRPFVETSQTVEAEE
jgi:dihydrofolate reductase